MERKWFPTGNLAWQVLRTGRGIVDRPNFYDAVESRRWVLVQQFYEVEILEESPGYGGRYQYTGNHEWRPVPILPPNPAPPTHIPCLIGPFGPDDIQSSPQAPNIAGPNQSSDPATG